MKTTLSIIFALMTIFLIVSGLKLWKRRKETKDISRYVLAIFYWFTSAFTFSFIFRTLAENTITYGPFLDPEHTFTPLLLQITFFIYPLSVIKSIKNPGRICAMLFTPPLAIFLIGLHTGIEYTTLNTYSDIWQNIGKPDVLLRFFAVIVMLSYTLALYFVPYDWHSSSVNRKFILKYSLGYCSIGAILFLELITHAKIFLLMHQLAMFSLFIWAAWYELHERLPVPENITLEEESLEYNNAIDRLWVNITRVLIEQQEWRNPELSLQSLSGELASNRTYIGEAFKKHAGCTFSEYVAKRRIEYVVSELKRNPHVSLQRTFSQAGFRERSTAYRNFHKIMGVTPTEYIESIK